MTLPSPTARRILLPLFRIALPSIILLASAACSKKSAANTAQSPPSVGVSTAQQKNVPVYGNWVGSLVGYVNANIQPQVSGYLIRQDYREGSLVRTGDVLFEIDPRPFQAALDQTMGQLAQAKGAARAGAGAIGSRQDQR